MDFPRVTEALLLHGFDGQRERLRVRGLDLIALRNKLELLGVFDDQVDCVLRPLQCHQLPRRIQANHVSDNRHLPADCAAGLCRFLAFALTRLLAVPPFGRRLSRAAAP